MIYFSQALLDEIVIRACDAEKIKELDQEACRIYEDASRAGLIDGAKKERKLCNQHYVKKFSKADLFRSLTSRAQIDWDAIERTYQKEIDEDDDLEHVEYYI